MRSINPCVQIHLIPRFRGVVFHPTAGSVECTTITWLCIAIERNIHCRIRVKVTTAYELTAVEIPSSDVIGSGFSVVVGIVEGYIPFPLGIIISNNRIRYLAVENIRRT